MKHNPPLAQRGFTLVEALVSIVVLTLGLMGIGKLVMTALKSNDSAYMRSQATALAYAILDDMRANRQVAMTQGYDVAMSDPYSAPTSCLSATCSTQDLATYDVALWKQKLGADSTTPGQLPGGNGSIVTVTGTNNQTTATITVQWNDALAQSAYSTSASTTSSPMSITLVTVL